MGKITNKIIKKYLSNYIMQILYFTYLDKYKEEPTQEQLETYAKEILSKMKI